MKKLLALLTVSLFATPAFAQVKQKIDKEFFDSPSSEMRTDSILILQNGKVLYERYRDPNSKVHKLWSISKALTSALTGIAISENRLSLDSSICDFFKNLETAKCAIQVRHLLQWSSGFEWSEDYGADPTTSSVLQMFYGDGSKDAVNFMLNRTVAKAPGVQWKYSSGDTVLLMGILSKVYSTAEYAELPEKKLFNRLGMTETVWEKDAAGTYLAASHAFSTPRDLAKFGELFLKNGRFKAQRILPSSWVRWSTQASPSFIHGDHQTTTLVGAAGWWANIAIPSRNIGQPWPAVGEDVFAARGFKGQGLYVLPRLNMVAIRFGYDSTATAFNENQFLGLVKELAYEGAMK